MSHKQLPSSYPNTCMTLHLILIDVDSGSHGWSKPFHSVLEQPSYPRQFNFSWYQDSVATHFTGTRQGGMGSHVPKVCSYHQEGGRLSEESGLGDNPLHGDASTCSIRALALCDRHPSSHSIFHESNSAPFIYFVQTLHFTFLDHCQLLTTS